MAKLSLQMRDLDNKSCIDTRQYTAICITIERAWHRCVGFEVGNPKLRDSAARVARRDRTAPELVEDASELITWSQEIMFGSGGVECDGGLDLSPETM